MRSGACWPGLLEQALQRAADVAFGGDQAGRRVGQPVGDPHLLDPVAERLGDALGQLLELAGDRFRLLALLLVGELAEVEGAARYRSQRRAVEFGEEREHPLVDPVAQQQDLDSLLAEDLEVRAVRAAASVSAVT